MAALEGIEVTAFRKKDDGTFVNSGSDTTDANGEYEVVGLDENEKYAYRFSDPTNTYVTVYKGPFAESGGIALSLEEAATFSPSEFEPIDITMYESASQGGTVTK